MFKLPDANGKMHALNDTDHQALLLVFFQPGCEESERFLQTIGKFSGEWQRQGLSAWMVEMPNSKETAPSALSASSQKLPFPVLFADQQTARVYDIFYRYLYERRRDMCLPTSFLLDEDRQVVKVYSGPANPIRIISDSQSKCFNTDERLRRALPFPGRYFGNGLHHNYFTYGVAFLQHDFLDQALSSFQTTVKFNPSHAGAYYNMGLIYLNKNMLEEAKTNLSKTVDLDPSDANAWNNLGVAYGESGEYEQADRNFRKALSVRPTHVLALQNSVKLYEYQGRPEEARKILEKALNVDPLDAENHLSFALFLAEQNDLLGAKKEFEQTIKIQPGNPEALNGVGAILMKTNSPIEAMSYLEQCRRLNPDFDRAYLNLASLYLETGNSKKAHEILAEFLTRHPENAEINQALKEIDGGK
jgi:Tfp pilus assembly protein PilF/peroxiredoxin